MSHLLLPSAIAELVIRAAICRLLKETMIVMDTAAQMNESDRTKVQLKKGEYIVGKADTQ